MVKARHPVLVKDNYDAGVADRRQIVRSSVGADGSTVVRKLRGQGHHPGEDDDVGMGARRMDASIQYCQFCAQSYNTAYATGGSSGNTEPVSPPFQCRARSGAGIDPQPILEQRPRWPAHELGLVSAPGWWDFMMRATGRADGADGADLARFWM
jgi:hypothetical protein